MALQLKAVQIVLGPRAFRLQGIQVVTGSRAFRLQALQLRLSAGKTPNNTLPLVTP